MSKNIPISFWECNINFDRYAFIYTVYFEHQTIMSYNDLYRMDPPVIRCYKLVYKPL